MIRRSALIQCLLVASSLLLSAFGQDVTIIPGCGDGSLSTLNVPAPWYEAPISSDPRAACGGAGSCNYGYAEFDSSDSTQLQAIHRNMITLTGGPAGAVGQYVNLTAPSGSSAIGRTLPGYLFSPSTGNIQKGTYGWSFETTFKADSQQQWGKIFDIGNPNSGGCRDDVVFGWTDTNQRTEFTWCNGGGGEVKLMSYYRITPGVWYHVVIVVQQIGNTAGTGQFINPRDANANSNWHIYINGQSVGTWQDGYQPSTRPGPYPTSVNRKDASLGRSSWADRYWAGKIRHFNVYDQALTYKQIDALYRKRMGSGCSLQTGPTDTTNLYGAPSYYNAAVPSPTWALPVNDRPSNANDINYGWMQNDPVDASCGLATQHSGLIVLGGSYNEGLGAAAGGPFINLAATTGGNSIPQATPFPQIGGASAGNVDQGTYGWTIELVMKPQLVETWAKVFDIANPQVSGSCRDNIVAGWQDNGPGWTFTTCDANGVEYNNRYTAFQASIAQWNHAIMIIQQQPNGNATYLVYLNGELLSHNPGQYYPPSKQRTNAYLGRSSWAADFFWDGYIDYFNVYNVALTAPQVASRFQTAMGSNQGTNKYYCPVPNNPVNTMNFVESTLLFRSDFNNDPRGAAGGASSALYDWVDTDSTDSATDQSLHRGLIRLNAGTINNQYINLTSSSGPNSIGQVLDTSKVGGRETSGNVFNGTAGFTFEITWKATAQPAWSKLIDIGATRFDGGRCNYDIFFGWHGSDAQDLDFQICDYDGTAYGPNPFTNTLGTLNVWHHFVASIAQTENGLSNYTLYMDGAVAWSGVNQYYPTALPRPNAVIGDSNWAADDNWKGYVDTFAIYKQALNPTQVALLYSRAMIPVSLPSCDSTASAVSVPQPWFSLNVTTDPRRFPNVQYAYGWTAVDSNDDPRVQAVHNGLIVLGGGAAGSASQFVNLTAFQGSPNSLGYNPPGLMGGSGAIDATAARGTAGWTFEVTIKPTARATWGKIFDFGATRGSNPSQCNEDILLGWDGDSSRLQFDYCDAQGREQSIYTSTELRVGQWYHIVAVMQQLVGPDGQGTASAHYRLYINNVLSGQIHGKLPLIAPRQNSIIGRSGWAQDAYFSGMLDSLNIYNYALNTAQINAMYLNKMNACPITVPTGPNAFINYQSPTVPFFTSSAPTSPPTAQQTHYTLPTETRPANVDTSFYNWIQQDDSDVSCGINQYHQGIIQLGGSSNPGYEGPYINMSATSGPRSIGSSALQPIGGAGTGDLSTGTRGWSFEFLVKPIIVEEWSKLFDIGNPQVNGACRDDILTGWEGYGPEWSFTVCDENGNTANLDNAFGGNVNVTDWTHGIIVIQQSDSGANYFVYANGKLVDFKPAAIYPALKPRVNGFLGRSGWAADSYWDGNIDLFKIYSVAITPTQARNMWNAVSNNGQAAPTCNAPTPTSGNIDASNILLDLTFDSDPRPAAGGAGTAKFGWSASDASDSTGDQNIHKGLLYLAGGGDATTGTPNAGFNGNYVNLSTSSGPTFVGKTLDPLAIGDVGKGNENAGTAGWTWEITFKPTASANWAKIFDFGSVRNPNGPCRYDILFGQYGTNASQASFSSCDQRGNEYGLRPAMNTISLNKWHHVVLIIELGPNGQGIYTTYLNGRQQPAVETQGWYPTVGARTHGLIGRSNWGADQYWSGFIDTFRIYSVAATPYQVDTLYRKMLDPSYVPVDPANPSSSSSSGLSGGAIAGIVIGSIVGAIILAIIAAVVCCGLGARGKKSSSSDYDSNRGNNASHRFDEMEASRNVEMSNVQGETHDNEETV